MTPQSFEETKYASFPGQHPDEKIILLKRRHPIVLVGFTVYLAIMILLPAIFYLNMKFTVGFDIGGLLLRLFIFTSGIYLLFVFSIMFLVIMDYYLDIWIITDQRIMAIEQKGLFGRVVTEIRYDRIQDITSEISGFIPTFFKFGNISIQTAAEKERVVLKQIPDPINTRRTIAEVYKKTTDRIENLENKPRITI